MMFFSELIKGWHLIKVVRCSARARQMSRSDNKEGMGVSCQTVGSQYTKTHQKNNNLLKHTQGHCDPTGPRWLSLCDAGPQFFAVPWPNCAVKQNDSPAPLLLQAKEEFQPPERSAAWCGAMQSLDGVPVTTDEPLVPFQVYLQRVMSVKTHANVQQPWNSATTDAFERAWIAINVEPIKAVLSWEKWG